MAICTGVKISVTALAVVVVTAGLVLAQGDQKVKPKADEQVIEAKNQTRSKPEEGAAVTKNTGTEQPAATRAGSTTCDVWVSNFTPWVIHRLYIDRQPWGSVGRRADVIAYDVVAGPTRLYAEADFTDGSTKFWGPQVVNCDRYSTFRWNLR
jgi:hypothetical protein